MLIYSPSSGEALDAQCAFRIGVIYKHLFCDFFRLNARIRRAGVGCGS